MSEQFNSSSLMQRPNAIRYALLFYVVSFALMALQLYFRHDSSDELLISSWLGSANFSLWLTGLILLIPVQMGWYVAAFPFYVIAAGLAASQYVIFAKVTSFSILLGLSGLLIAICLCASIYCLARNQSTIWFLVNNSRAQTQSYRASYQAYQTIVEAHRQQRPMTITICLYLLGLNFFWVLLYGIMQLYSAYEILRDQPAINTHDAIGLLLSSGLSLMCMLGFILLYMRSIYRSSWSFACWMMNVGGILAAILILRFFNSPTVTWFDLISFLLFFTPLILLGLPNSKNWLKARPNFIRSSV